MIGGRGLAACAALALAGCAMPPSDGPSEGPVGETREPLTATCEVTLGGKKLDVEADYLPHVVDCENGGASPEALRVQAVAARTYLYYKLETSGAITDGQGDQVYSCGKTPSAAHAQAVKDTAGEVLRYDGTTIASFFVAGGKASPPACKGDSTAATEKYVTYNEGKSGAGITQTTLGFVSPSNARNRGCMSQNGSDCLAKAGKGYADILRFYYGADIAIERATGPCVPAKVEPDGGAPDAGGSSSGGADGGAGVDAGPPPNPGDPFAGGGGGDDGGCSAAPGPLNGGAGAALVIALAALSAAWRRRSRPSACS